MSYRRQALHETAGHLAYIVGAVGVFALAALSLGAKVGDVGYVEIGAACVVLCVPVAGSTWRVLTGIAPYEDGRGLRAIGRLSVVVVLALVWAALVVPLALAILAWAEAHRMTG